MSPLAGVTSGEGILFALCQMVPEVLAMVSEHPLRVSEKPLGAPQKRYRLHLRLK